MKLIKVELYSNAPYSHTYLIEDYIYSEVRNVYMIAREAFELVIENQKPKDVISEYPDWDRKFKKSMVDEYRPSKESATPLMPRIIVCQDAVEVPLNLLGKLLNRRPKIQKEFSIYFGNGRHRFNFIRHFGAQAIPFQMSESSAKNLNELAGSTVCTIVE